MKSRTCPRCTGRGPWRGMAEGSGSKETSQGHGGLSGFVVLLPVCPPPSFLPREGLSGPRFPGLPCLQRERQLSHPDGRGSRAAYGPARSPEADLLTSSDAGPALGHPELRGGTSERSLVPSIARSPRAHASASTSEHPTTLLRDSANSPSDFYSLPPPTWRKVEFLPINIPHPNGSGLKPSPCTGLAARTEGPQPPASPHGASEQVRKGCLFLKGLHCPQTMMINGQPYHVGTPS